MPKLYINLYLPCSDETVYGQNTEISCIYGAILLQ